MKIAIDISPIIYGTGVSVYTRELVKSLLEIDSENEYILFGGSLRRRGEFIDFYKSLKAKNVQLKTSYLSPTLADALWNRLHIFPIEYFVGKIDVYHSSDWAQAPSKAYKVTTVHDLAPFIYSDQTPKSVVNAHKRRLKHVKKEVDAIIAPSHSTSEDLQEIFQISNKLIHIIPEGIDDIYNKRLSEKEISKTLRKYSISKPYIITVGAGNRKNTDNLIASFEKSTFNGQLVIVGEYNINNNRVVITGRVSDEELVALYCGAEALVYVSLYEGFGLPILQAMAIGIPVVTSNVSSMPEVAGNAAILVDPLNIEEIISGIEKALKTPKLLVKKGKQRVKMFNWDKTAKETIKIYNKAK